MNVQEELKSDDDLKQLRSISEVIENGEDSRRVSFNVISNPVLKKNTSVVKKDTVEFTGCHEKEYSNKQVENLINRGCCGVSK